MSAPSDNPTERARELRSRLLSIPGDTSPRELAAAWRLLEEAVQEALDRAGSPFAHVITVEDADRERAAALLAEGLEMLRDGRPEEAMPALLRAAANDPWCASAREATVAAHAASGDGANLPGQRPLQGARAEVVRVPLEAVLADPALLERLAKRFAGREDVTVAVDASAARDPGLATSQLSDLVARCGLADDDRLDLLLVLGPLDEVGRARLAAGSRPAEL